MQQIKRPGGNSGNGYYTSWSKSSSNGCIYCGNPADTREHCPSKVFLLEPYPDNLPTVPACFECNNGFSEDEKYVASYIESLKCEINQEYHMTLQCMERIKEDEALSNLLQNEIITLGNTIKYTYNQKRFERVLSKLAVCHAGYECDYVEFSKPTYLWYDFAMNLSNETIENFNSIAVFNAFPEIGSRYGLRDNIIQNIQTGEALGIALWNEIQEDRYRYQVYVNDMNGITVKIAICEFLFVQVDFK